MGELVERMGTVDSQRALRAQVISDRFPVGTWANSGILHIAPGRHGTTILPWGWQTGDCPGGCNRRRFRLRLRLRFWASFARSFEVSFCPSFERCFEMSFQISSLTSFQVSFRTSFPMSFPESFVESCGELRVAVGRSWVRRGRGRRSGEKRDDGEDSVVGRVDTRARLDRMLPTRGGSFV